MTLYDFCEVTGCLATKSQLFTFVVLQNQYIRRLLVVIYVPPGAKDFLPEKYIIVYHKCRGTTRTHGLCSAIMTIQLAQYQVPPSCHADRGLNLQLSLIHGRIEHMVGLYIAEIKCVLAFLIPETY